MKQIYLDYAATTPVDPVVAEAILPYIKDIFGNPSSIYTIGQGSRTAIEKAREDVTGLIGAKPEEIIFTSSGTESDNLAIKGIAYANRDKGNHIITTEIEHHAVLESTRFLETQGFSVTYIKPDKYGWISPDKIKNAITKKTVLISVMHANNEIGTIEPIKEIGRIAKEHGIYFHIDAVQTVGHIPVSVDELGVDLLSLSGHKFYGPKGVGALYIRKGTKIAPIIHGGGQERHIRAGTENLSSIVGLGKAAEIVKGKIQSETTRLTGLRDMLIKGLLEKIPETKLNGHPTERLPNNINITIPNIEGEAVILHLNELGIYAGTGSACSAYDLGPSHILLAIGLSQQMAHSSVRFTLGMWNTKEDIEYLLQVLPNIIGRLLEEEK